jgi:Ser/Thr protein kinase RdoA (MazF antagonist)
MIKPYDDLSYHGKARRVRRLVLKALEHYDLKIKRIRFISLWTNGIFRLHATDDRRYLIRVCAPAWRSETDLRSEIAWLLALGQDSDIGAPQPQPTRDGAFFVTESDPPGLPLPLRCIVFDWKPGVRLGLRFNKENLHAMGQLFARLHQHALRFKPPKDFTRLKMDSPYVRGAGEVLFDKHFRPHFSAANHKIFTRVHQRVKNTYAALYADSKGLRVIHHDLYHDNISVHRGQLYPFDFEDTVWGYPIQDIATAMRDLLEDTPATDYMPLRQSFRAGYESLESWPERHDGELDTLVAAHFIESVNRTAHSDPGSLAQKILSTAPLLNKLLATGITAK